MPAQYSPSGGKFPLRHIHFRTPAVGLSATTNPVPVLFPPLFVRGPRANSLSRFVWKKETVHSTIVPGHRIGRGAARPQTDW